MLERPGGDLGLGSVSGRRLKQRGLFPFQEFIPSPGISSEGGWFGLLFLLVIHGQGHLRRVLLVVAKMLSQAFLIASNRHY